MTTPDVLSMLCGDDADQRFVNEYWPEQLFTFHGPPARILDLMAIGQSGMEGILELPREGLRANGRTLSGTSCTLLADSKSARALYDAGFTLYFTRLRSPYLSLLCEALDAQLCLSPGTTQVDAFASRRGARSLPTHFDSDESFIVQIRGRKSWRVAPNRSIRYPTQNYVMGMDPTEEMKAEGCCQVPLEMPMEHCTVAMEPGSVMFLPRGYWHDTNTLDEESIHLVIEAKVPTWRDVLLYALTHGSAAAGVEWRTPVPGLWRDNGVPSRVVMELAERTRALASRIAEGRPEDLGIPNISDRREPGAGQR